MAYRKRMVDMYGFGLAPRAAPNSATVGQIYYDSTADLIYGYDGTSWVALSKQFIGSGGKMTTYTASDVTYMVHTFLSSGVFIPQAAGTVDYLIVGGGGQGANGGGGAGAVLTAADYDVTAQAYTIVVGGNNTGSSLTPTTGPAFAAHRGGMNASGTPHGSGPGGGDNGCGFAGTAGQGSAGGNSATAAYGGGGGAGGVGVNYSGSVGGAGGVGLKQVMGLSVANSTLLLAAAAAGVVESSDSNYRYIAGGGGGADNSAPGGSGGLGGGGSALDLIAAGSGGHPQAGEVNTGGGGGGGYNTGAGYGGSGIVIIRYVI